MTITSVTDSKPFITADGSEIRSLLDLSNAPVENQSLAEAKLPPHGSTDRHYHRHSEEFYLITAGTADMEIEGESRSVTAGNAILIPKNAWHKITAGAGGVTLLCCCAPPYAHEDTYFE